MKKIGIHILIIAMVLVSFKQTAFASDINGTEYIDEYFDFSVMENVINRGGAYDIDLKDIFLKAISGEIELSPEEILKAFIGMLFNEVILNIGLMRNIIILGVASAALKALMDAFKNKGVGEIGFYVSYAAMVMLLLSSFKIAADILTGFVSTVTGLIEAGTPMFVSLVVMSGNFTGGYILSSIMVFASAFINKLVMYVIAPAIITIATLQTVNYLTESDTLTNFSKLLKNIISWSVKIIAIGLVSIVSIQKLSAPFINNLALKTAKSTINAVPIVGGILTGAVESVLQWTQACRGGVLAVVIIAMVSICAVPIIKLISLIFVYRLTAALIQPICDKRFVDCVNSMGDYTSLMLSCGTIVSLMFLICVVIMLSF